ncbi:hypothetical protein HYT32_02905 [Candidatus Roizmanbacteria bacterium]|nr:hypothetical protein [Candidatus Roizmanbacteria bacterium]
MRYRYLVYWQAFKLVFEQKSYLLGFLISILVFLSVYLYIPIKNIPGNDLMFQLSILKPKDYILLTFLAALTSVSLVMNFYLLKNKVFGASTSLVGHGALGGISGVIASVFGAATCAACAVSFFGFLGVSTVFFLLEYRWYIVIGSLAVLFFSLYFTSKKVLDLCEDCNDYKS